MLVNSDNISSLSSRAFIKQISVDLQSSGELASLRSRDPHILTSDSAKSSSQTGLSVSLDLVIKASRQLANHLVSPNKMMESYLRNLKIRVLKVDSDASKKMIVSRLTQIGASSPETLKKLKIEHRDVRLYDLLPMDGVSRLKKITSDTFGPTDVEMYNLTTRVTFDMGSTNPSHLSFIAFTCSEKSKTVSPYSCDTVFVDSTIPSETYIMLDSNNAIWLDRATRCRNNKYVKWSRGRYNQFLNALASLITSPPVKKRTSLYTSYRMELLPLMQGTTEPLLAISKMLTKWKERNPSTSAGDLYNRSKDLYNSFISSESTLIRRRIAVTKIKDFRPIRTLIKKSKRMEYNNSISTPVTPFQTSYDFGIEKFVADKKVRNSNFSELFLSTEMTGDVNGFFAMDYMAMLKSEISFIRRYQKLSSVILDFCPLLAMTIVRRRVEDNATGIMGLGRKSHRLMKQGISKEETIVGFYGPSGTSAKIEGSNPRGSLKEEQLSVAGQNNDIRYFTFKDRDIARIANGSYQYGVEFVFADNTVGIPRSHISKIKSIKSTLQEYQAQCSSVSNHDISTGRITSAIAPKSKELKELINGYISTMEYLNLVSPNSVSAKGIYNLIAPRIGTLSGIALFLEAVDGLASMLQDSIGSKESASSSTRDATANFYSSAARTRNNKLIKIKKFFNTTVNASETMMPHYEYMPTISEGSNMPSISVSAFSSTYALSRVPAAVCSMGEKTLIGSEVRFVGSSTDAEKRESEEAELRNLGLSIINHSFFKSMTAGKNGLMYNSLNLKEKASLNLEHLNANNSYTYFDTKTSKEAAEMSNEEKASYDTSIRHYFGLGDSAVHKVDTERENHPEAAIIGQTNLFEQPSEVFVGGEITSQLLMAYRSQARGVETFSGFVTDPKGKPLLKKAIFAPLGKISDSNTRMFCRIAPPQISSTRPDFATKRLTLPVHKEYFMINPDNSSPMVARFSQEMRDYFKDESRLATVNEQEYISVGSIQTMNYSFTNSTKAGY